MTLAMNKVLAFAINNMLMMLVLPTLMAEHVKGVKMMVTIWRTCSGHWTKNISTKERSTKSREDENSVEGDCVWC
jgi:hypothetical protein